MKRIVTGKCEFDNIYTLDDPNKYIELEFQEEVKTALKCLLPEYYINDFSGLFEFEGEKKRPDLVLLHKKLKHWFIVEVELAGHSLNDHILPQIRCFRYGDPVRDCAKSLSDAFSNIKIESCIKIIKYLPRYTAVIDNFRNIEWENSFKALDTSYLTLSIYSNEKKIKCYELEGKLFAKRESLGFAQYSEIDKCMKISSKCGLAEGIVQMYDQFDNLSEWNIIPVNEVLWISKKSGKTLFQHKSYIQILKDSEGRLFLRPSVN